jgi:hypothetical protein
MKYGGMTLTKSCTLRQMTGWTDYTTVVENLFVVSSIFSLFSISRRRKLIILSDEINQSYRIEKNRQMIQIPTYINIQINFQFFFWMGAKYFCFSKFQVRNEYTSHPSELLWMAQLHYN